MEATYTNIDPGKYTFRVIASNNDGLWNLNGAKVHISVLPPWYGTMAFKIISLLLTTVLIWLFIKYRTANLEKKRILLEKTVKEKTASLIEANNELQKYNNTKDKLFSLISHDLVSPFNTIIGFSEVLKEGYDHLDETEKKNYIGMINESSEKVYVLLNNLLVWSRSQTNRITCNPGAVRLKALIDEVLELNSERLKVKNIKVKVECPFDLQVIADLEMLKTIIRNLFSNALKFTLRSGNIFISVKPDSTKVNVSVIDTGVGMSPEKIDELLSETLVESESGTEGESGTGFGLTICKDFIKRNNGELHITSEPGKGSKFTFSLPLAAN
jgi:signal transduction histidine kinase